MQKGSRVHIGGKPSKVQDNTSNVAEFGAQTNDYIGQQGVVLEVDGARTLVDVNNDELDLKQIIGCWFNTSDLTLVKNAAEKLSLAEATALELETALKHASEPVRQPAKVAEAIVQERESGGDFTSWPSVSKRTKGVGEKALVALKQVAVLKHMDAEEKARRKEAAKQRAAEREARAAAEPPRRRPRRNVAEKMVALGHASVVRCEVRGVAGNRHMWLQVVCHEPPADHHDESAWFKGVRERYPWSDENGNLLPQPDAWATSPDSTQNWLKFSLVGGDARPLCNGDVLDTHSSIQDSCHPHQVRPSGETKSLYPLFLFEQQTEAESASKKGQASKGSSEKPPTTTKTVEKKETTPNASQQAIAPENYESQIEELKSENDMLRKELLAAQARNDELSAKLQDLKI